MSQPMSAVEGREKGGGAGTNSSCERPTARPEQQGRGLCQTLKPTRPRPRMRARFTRLTLKEVNYSGSHHGVVMYMNVREEMAHIIIGHLLDRSIMAPSWPGARTT